jgi:diacylglycerol O-acyltransferase
LIDLDQWTEFVPALWSGNYKKRAMPMSMQDTLMLTPSRSAPARPAFTETPPSTHRVSPLDAAWLYVESPDTPMHVGCLQVFAKPKNASADYTLKIHQELLNCKCVVPPYSLKPGGSMINAVLPIWVDDPHPDLDYHLRRVALPHPGAEPELGALLSRLQSIELDMTRPLWECYLIDGLEKNRYALFIKIHHSLVDGIGGMQMLQSALSTDPRERHMPAPWASHEHRGLPSTPPEQHSADKHLHGVLSQALQLALTQLRSGPGVVRALSTLARAAMPGAHSLLSAPYTAPVTVFNGQTSAQRSYATLQLPLKRVQDLAHRAGVKLNDVFLTICGGALRRYLQDIGGLPAHSLTAGIPVSIRPRGDASVGTAITFALSTLATDLDDPGQRLHRVHQATVAAKEHLKMMDKTALIEYTLLLMAPYILELMAGLGGRGHPVFNLAISNVPGPEKTLYYNGARMLAMYPMSVLTHGQSLNITTISYAGQLNIGYTACKIAVPRVQRLAEFTLDALDELESVFPVRRTSRHMVSHGNNLRAP